MTLLPAVTTPTVAVALLDEPVITSPAIKSSAPALPSNAYDMGVVVVRILAWAPLDAPTIFSPLANVPVELISVMDGSVASADVSSESYTATNL